MSRWLAMLLALAGCATTHEAKVAVRQDVLEQRAVQAAERVQEDRGEVVTVVEEYAPEAQKDEGPSGGPGPSVESRVGPTAVRADKPTLLRRTTITQGPVHTVATARVAEREVAQATTKVDASTASTSKPSAGCAFSAGLLVIPLALLGAALLWRRFHA